MPTKLERNTYPDNSGPNDFKCSGPVASEDTKFDGFKMADLGCFLQEGVDSNKFYFACVTQHKTNGQWFLYVEYGRVGAGKPSFQFSPASNEAEAMQLFAKQCAEKNTKRGEWQTIGGVRLFRPIVKKGKPEDLYVVRDLVKRDYGLPDARSITSSNHQPVSKPKTTGGTKAFRCDNQTTKLMRDLVGGAITYTRTSIQGGTVPTLKAIAQGRDLIQNTIKRIAVVGPDVKAQIADKDIRQMTYALYGLIPKVKPLHCPEEDWILSDRTTSSRRQSNIDGWNEDLDAFETACKAGDTEVVNHDDPMDGMPADMEWIDLSSELGIWLANWWANASRNVHHGVGKMSIQNLWKVDRHGDIALVEKTVNQTQAELTGVWNNERPNLGQDKKRFDLDVEARKRYWDANVGMMFHGTRSVNCAGIIRENLRLPKVMTNGWMYGPGVYWAIDWRKSAGYTSLRGSYWSGGGGSVAGRKAFMFVGDVVMGQPHIAKGSHSYSKPPAKHHSVWAKAGSAVANDEIIVYDTSRFRLRYLAEFDTK